MLATLIGPAGLAVSLEQAKKHLRIDHDDENETLDLYLRTAIEFMESETGLRLAPVTLQLRLPAWSSVELELPQCLALIKLPVAPVRDVERISYIDQNKAEQTLAEAEWLWQLGDKRRAEVGFTRAFTSPDLYAEDGDQVLITFSAGFDLEGQTGSGDNPDLALPYLARAGVLLLTGHWYENREETVAGALSNLAPGVRSICEKLKLWT